MLVHSLALALCLAAPAGAGQNAAPEETSEIIVKKLQAPAGFHVDLIAREPQLLNPVAFSIDEGGRIYVAETYRLHRGVTDIRGHMDWLLDDLACRTVADQEALLRRRLDAEEARKWARAAEQVRLLEDTDGDGHIDRSRVYAGGFDGLISGIGSGVLARGGKVWYTSIPDLWLLRDTSGDGLADTREALSTGYGVHISFIGHDSHGLVIGPDGRLYFTIGDRGFNVPTTKGRLAFPDTGAVLRCELDGSGLEVYAWGLRNPQELAFDAYGNLFTGDNNSDGGDRARLVHVVEGGDSGWRIGYQSLDDRGPWNTEKLWHLGDHAASQVPPIAHIGRGPSGLTFNPGTGLPARYDGHFFMCDFPGGILSFKLIPAGSTFEVTGLEQFLWNLYPTDVDFGPGGGLYVLDWVEGWDMPKKGRVFHVTHAEAMAEPIVSETRGLIARDFQALPLDTLCSRVRRDRLLAHRDYRVRQAVQFALAAHGRFAQTFLAELAAESTHEFEQLHSIWAVGQIARQHADAAIAVQPLADSAYASVRAQVARILGESRLASSFPYVMRLMNDADKRVRFEATMALGRFGRAEALAAIVTMLRDAANQDPNLRHAGVMGLSRLAEPRALTKLGQDDSAAVRLAALLALRRLERPEVAEFLHDKDPLIVREAARAINDVPIDPATPMLAALVEQEITDEVTLRRALHASFRRGGRASAEAITALAARSGAAEPVRVFALRLLREWAGPTYRDGVTGAWRPLPERDPAPARDALAARFDELLGGPERVQIEAVRGIAALRVVVQAPRLDQLVRAHERPPQVRAEALSALAELQDERLSSAVLAALQDAEQPVVGQAISLLAEAKIPDSLARLSALIFSDAATPTRQAAIAALARLRTSEAAEAVAKCLDALIVGKLPAALALDVIECARACEDAAVRQKFADFTTKRASGDWFAQHSELLAGGDARAGRRVFEKQEAMCLKCHVVDGHGGQVGPDLSGVGAVRTRGELLESLLLPNKVIADGYRSVVLFTADDTFVGRVLREDADHVTLLDAEGQTRQVRRAGIEERREGLSAMPENVTELLSPAKIRDLVAYLATLRHTATNPN